MARPIAVQATWMSALASAGKGGPSTRNRSAKTRVSTAISKKAPSVNAKVQRSHGMAGGGMLGRAAPSASVASIVVKA